MTTLTSAPTLAPVRTGFVPVTRQAYSAALRAAWSTRPEISASVTDYRDPADVDPSASAYLSRDGASGYLIVGGDLRGVFSAVRGRGAEIITSALDHGARTLDCFDGYLPELYARHGFRETSREPNWTPGGPDVVFMAHREAGSAAGLVVVSVLAVLAVLILLVAPIVREAAELVDTVHIQQQDRP